MQTRLKYIPDMIVNASWLVCVTIVITGSAPGGIIGLLLVIAIVAGAINFAITLRRLVKFWRRDCYGRQNAAYHEIIENCWDLDDRWWHGEMGDQLAADIEEFVQKAANIGTQIKDRRKREAIEDLIIRCSKRIVVLLHKPYPPPTLKSARHIRIFK